MYQEMPRPNRPYRPGHGASAWLLWLTFAGAARVLALLAVPSASHAATNRLPLGRDSVAIVEHAINLDRDRLKEGLELRCDIVLSKPGKYYVTPTLSTEIQCFGWWGWPLTADAYARSALEDLQAGREPKVQLDAEVRTDVAGRARLDVCFDGNDLARLRQDGPWWFSISAARLDSAGDIVPAGDPSRAVCLLAQTGAWRRDQFDKRYMGELAPYHPALAGYFGRDVRSSDEVILSQGWDLVVAHVVRSDSGGTRGSPPQLTLQVDRTLRGRGLAGSLETVWAPQPLFVPCPVGEEGNIRRWRESSYPAPPPGSRWILAGVRAPNDSLWRNSEFFRWPYSDSLLTHFESAIAAWPAKLARLEQKKFEFERLQRETRIRAEKQARVAAERARVKARRSWLASVSQTARAADITELVRQSECIAVGYPDMSGFDPGRWDARAVRVQIAERLRWDSPKDTASHLQVYVTAREEPVAKLWRKLPPELGAQAPNHTRIRCVVFARHTAMADGFAHATRILRLVSAESGILMLDEHQLRELRRTVARRPFEEGVRSTPPSTTWRDFAHLPDSALDSVGVKISPLFLPTNYWANRQAVVMACVTPRPGYLADERLFWSRALADSAYHVDHDRYSLCLEIRRDEMARLLDSLVTLGPVQEGRVSRTDSVSVMLRRLVNGLERTFECTLDPASVVHLAAILADAVSPPERLAGEARPRPSERLALSLPRWLEGLGPGYGRRAWEAQRRYLRQGATP